jgi:hypothetical protein
MRQSDYVGDSDMDRAVAKLERRDTNLGKRLDAKMVAILSSLVCRQVIEAERERNWE